MTGIYIAAALAIRPNGQTLLVRKRQSAAFMQPGGKIEAGETPLQALVRELEEEIGLVINPGGATFLGRFSAPAANEMGAIVTAELFSIRVIHDLHPAREIEEIRWIGPDDTEGLQLAPLTADHVLPLYRAMLRDGRLP